jgi:hypothetical protein
MSVKVFVWQLFDKDFNFACPLQGANPDSINKLNKGKHHHGWCKAMDILKQDRQFLFGDTYIRQGNNNEKIKATYERLMSTLDSISEMSQFFTSIQIRAIKNMVRENIMIFQNIWEVTNQEQG